MKMTKRKIIKDDGRYLIYYEFEDEQELKKEEKQDQNMGNEGGN